MKQLLKKNFINVEIKLKVYNNDIKRNDNFTRMACYGCRRWRYVVSSCKFIKKLQSKKAVNYCLFHYLYLIINFSSKATKAYINAASIHKITVAAITKSNLNT